jgi:lipopolysaccharide assembly protein A
MWLLQWTLKAAIFFTLFAFALNNQEYILVHFFFGATWRAPLIVVVLSVFVLGVAVGVMGMLPRWWKLRRLAKSSNTSTSTGSPSPSVSDKPALPDTAHGI